MRVVHFWTLDHIQSIIRLIYPVKHWSINIVVEHILAYTLYSKLIPSSMKEMVAWTWFTHFLYYIDYKDFLPAKAFTIARVFKYVCVSACVCVFLSALTTPWPLLSLSYTLSFNHTLSLTQFFIFYTLSLNL